MPPDTSPRPHVAELDGLRGLACLSILLWHLVREEIAPRTGFWGGLRVLLSQTWSGVDLFFVLSGFLILGSLWDREGKGNLVSGFLRARAFRLVPAYVLLLVGLVVFRAATNSASPSSSVQLLHADLLPLWVYACFGQGWYIVLMPQVLSEPFANRMLSVTWSLAAEAEFYLGAVLVVVVVARERRTMTFAWLALLAVLIRAAIVLYASAASPAAFVLPPARMDGFALGALVACALRSPAVRAYAATRASALIPVWLVLALGIAFLTLNDSSFSGRFAANFSYGWMALFYATGLTWVVLRSGEAPIGVLARGPLAWLGVISYSVFLFHIPLHYLYIGLLGLPSGYITHPGGLAYVAGEVALVLAVGAASYALVERPSIEWGRRWWARRPASP